LRRRGGLEDGEFPLFCPLKGDKLCKLNSFFSTLIWKPERPWGLGTFLED